MIDNNGNKSTVKKSSKKKVAANKAAPKKSINAKSDKATNTSSVKEKRTTTSGRRGNDQVMTGLLKNLQGVFDKIYSDNTKRDHAHDKLAEEFTSHMQKAFLEMHTQIEERERLLETQLKSVDLTHKHQMQGVKILSIPVTLLSIVAIVYLFYVVRIMETSITSMSGDMHIMTTYMETITADTTALSTNVATMNTSMNGLNTNVGNMMMDVNQMSRSVTPAMRGINRFVP